MLKSATSKAGQRYTPPPHLRERFARLASQEAAQPGAPGFRTAPAPPSRSTRRFELLGWATAAALLLLSVSIVLVQRSVTRSQIAAAEHAALVTEVFDQHIATLAASLPPQVLSTDRHTVKPWFQGKAAFQLQSSGQSAGRHETRGGKPDLSPQPAGCPASHTALGNIVSPSLSQEEQPRSGPINLWQNTQDFT